MPTTNFSSLILKGAGTRGIPEIPGGGGSSFSNTKSLLFDGVDEKVSTTSINLGLENTISFWAKSDGTNFNGMVLGGIVQSNYYTVFLTSTNRLLYRVGGGANSFDDADIISALSSGNWFHCALVRNNSGADVLCYINGDLKQTKTSIIGSANDTIIQDMGARSINDFYLTGNIDELSLYNTALNGTDISTIATAPSDLSTYNPILWYRNGDGDTFPTITDNGSGGNNGTMINMEAEDIVNDVPT